MNKKVFLVVSSIEKGGTQKIVLDLFNYWKEKRYDVKIITFDKNIKDIKSEVRKNLINLDLQNTSKNFIQSIFNNLGRIYKLRSIIKKSNNQIFSFISTTNILSIIANIGLKNNLIISERNDPEIQNISNVWIILRKIFYRFANKVTANSKKACAYLEKFVSKKKIFFIPNHIFFEKKKNNKIKKEKIILAVGRLHHQKGFDILIKSFYLSKVYKNGWKLVILGKGPEEKYLKNKVKEFKLTNKVFFKGFIDPGNWYKRSKIFILSSRFEGTPNVLLEAVSMGLPTIITNSCPGAMYYLKNNISTLVVPPENSHALSKSIVKLIYNKNLQKKIESEAFKSVKELANHKKIFKKWDFFLKEM